MRRYLLFFLLYAGGMHAQQVPLNLQQNRLWYLEREAEFNRLDNRTHTAIRPWLAGENKPLLTDSLGEERSSVLYRKIFREHLIDYKSDDWSIQFDLLGELQLGRGNGPTLMTNTRAVQVQGNIGTKFAFYSSFFETQGKYPDYINRFVQQRTVLPAQGFSRDNGSGILDNSQSVAYISYSPNKVFNFQLGHDRHFIGEGHRSLLLSDANFPHPYFRILTTVGPFQYMYLISQYSDLIAPRLSNALGNRQKYSAIGFLDWQITKRFSLGFYQAVVWQADDSTGRRGLDFNYLNPFIFLRPVEFSLGSEGNMLLGLSAKLKLTDNHQLYGQFILDEFDFAKIIAQNGYWANKYGYQLGYKGFKLFGIANLSAQTEVNIVRPYTYSHWTSLTNFGQYNEPLAHPFGANFKEWTSFINYRHKRYYGQMQFMLAQIGLDQGGLSYGQDIFTSYFARVAEEGNTIGQGLTTDILFGGLKAGYILNTQTNLRLELTVQQRSANNSLGNQKDNWITIGLVTGVRNLYYDF